MTDTSSPESTANARRRITIAKHAGYCYGVERAYNQVVRAAADGKGPVITYGPLIHNPQTIDELEQRHGVSYADSPKDVDAFAHSLVEGADGGKGAATTDAGQKGRVFIRTHGVPPDLKSEFRCMGLDVIDATCPYVIVTQRHAAKLHAEGFHVVILGSASHPEVISILAHAEGDGTVLNSVAEVNRLPAGRRLGVVIQSTNMIEKVCKIVQAMMDRFPEVRVYNTICYTTTERQEETQTMARVCDHILVIGGHTSANTDKLRQTAVRYGARQECVQKVERRDELDLARLGDARHIGVLAGASTPFWLIEEIVAYVREYLEGLPGGGGPVEIVHLKEAVDLSDQLPEIDPADLLGSQAAST